MSLLLCFEYLDQVRVLQAIRLLNQIDAVVSVVDLAMRVLTRPWLVSGVWEQACTASAHISSWSFRVDVSRRAPRYAWCFMVCLNFLYRRAESRLQRLVFLYSLLDVFRCPEHTVGKADPLPEKGLYSVGVVVALLPSSSHLDALFVVSTGLQGWRPGGRLCALINEHEKW